MTASTNPDSGNARFPGSGARNESSSGGRPTRTSAADAEPTHGSIAEDGPSETGSVEDGPSTTGSAGDGPTTDTARDLQAVILDAGNTLLFADPRRVLETLRDEGVQADGDIFRRAEYSARLNLVQVVREGHRGTEAHIWEEYFLTLFRECGVPEDRMDAVGTRLLTMHEEDHLWTHVEEGTGAALDRLSETGYRLGVVSNADGRVEDLIETVGLRHHFEFVLDSGAVGVEKPDPAIFRMAVDRLGLEPRQCLYVGDLYPVDIVGARDAGLRAVLVDPFGRMEGAVDRIPSVRALPDYLKGAS